MVNSPRRSGGGRETRRCAGCAGGCAAGGGRDAEATDDDDAAEADEAIDPLRHAGIDGDGDGGAAASRAAGEEAAMLTMTSWPAASRLPHAPRRLRPVPGPERSGRSTAAATGRVVVAVAAGGDAATAATAAAGRASAAARADNLDASGSGGMQ